MTDRRARDRMGQVVVVHPRPRRHFRWGWVLVPMAILAMAWMVSRIEPAGTWKDVMDYVGVQNRKRYTQLAVLCLVGVGVAIIVRVLQGPTNAEGESRAVFRGHP